MLTAPMLPTLAVCLAVAITLGPTVQPTAIGVVPDEPGTLVLPARPTIQAVVADLRGVGAPDLVRLVEVEGAVRAEVWRHAGGEWARVGADLEVVPAFAAGPRGAPVRLVVRNDGERQRVTVARQPPFEVIGAVAQCCLELLDIEVGDTEVELRVVGSADPAVDAVLAIDLDEDGVDELLAKRSLPPEGGIVYPSQAVVFRWSGDRFGEPTTTELSIGSGDTPFVLGDTDGLAGEEVGIVTSATVSILHRVSLDQGDRVRVESAATVVDSATGIAVGDRTAVAMIGPVPGLAIHDWPAGTALGTPEGQLPINRGRIVGAVDLDSGPTLLVEEGETHVLRALALPQLEEDADGVAFLASAPARGSAGRLRPFRGALPGGGPDGAPALIVDGFLLPMTGTSARSGQVPAPIPTVSFAGAVPLGLAGPGRAWMAVAFGAGPGSQLDPRGGLIGVASAALAGGVSLAPLDEVSVPERDEGRFEPEVIGAVALDDEDTLGISATGFRAVVAAPPGSLVHMGVGDDANPFGVQAVPATGSLEVHVPLPRALLPYGGDRVTLTVATPAGAAYATSWDIVALTRPPEVLLEAATRLGSPIVEVRGRTAAFASVTVDDRPVTVDASGRFSTLVDLPPWPTTVSVVATDPVGNVARTSVTGVGYVDVRAFPWVGISVALLGALAMALFLRVPRRPGRHGLDDGAGLEELDPDEVA